MSAGRERAGLPDHMTDRQPDPVRRSGAETRPAGMCTGPGHVVVYGNPAFVTEFGGEAVGLPAREGMLGLPSTAFALLDAVLRDGRPFARWVRRGGQEWRLTAMPRLDPETGEPYGVAFHLRRRADRPTVLRD
jgi:hypothetical protein